MTEPEIRPVRLPGPAFDVQARVSQLEDFLNPNSSAFHRKEQHENIKKVIQLYQEGFLPTDDWTWVTKGHVVSKAEVDKGLGWVWFEVFLHPYFMYLLTQSLIGKMYANGGKVCIRKFSRF